MKKHFRKALSLFSIAIVSFSAFAGVALASSYTTSYLFGTTVTGQTRSFNGSNISFSSFAKSSFYHNLNKTYSVTLYRDNIFSDDKIGSKVLNRDMSQTTKWTNVGPGNYYVFLSKQNDGVTLSDNNVKIFN